MTDGLHTEYFSPHDLVCYTVYRCIDGCDTRESLMRLLKNITDLNGKGLHSISKESLAEDDLDISFRVSPSFEILGAVQNFS